MFELCLKRTHWCHEGYVAMADAVWVSALSGLRKDFIFYFKMKITQPYQGENWAQSGGDTVFYIECFKSLIMQDCLTSAAQPQ